MAPSGDLPRQSEPEVAGTGMEDVARGRSPIEQALRAALHAPAFRSSDEQPPVRSEPCDDVLACLGGPEQEHGVSDGKRLVAVDMDGRYAHEVRSTTPDEPLVLVALDHATNCLAAIEAGYLLRFRGVAED